MAHSRSLVITHPTHPIKAHICLVAFFIFPITTALLDKHNTHTHSPVFAKWTRSIHVDMTWELSGPRRSCKVRVSKKGEEAMHTMQVLDISSERVQKKIGRLYGRDVVSIIFMNVLLTIRAFLSRNCPRVRLCVWVKSRFINAATPPSYLSPHIIMLVMPHTLMRCSLHGRHPPPFLLILTYPRASKLVF